MKKTEEEIRRLMELRRSNAASPIQNKKKYSRKEKYKMSYRNDTIN